MGSFIRHFVVAAFGCVILVSVSYAITPSGYVGPGNSDCQPYTYGNGMTAINCPILDFPITTAGGPHTIGSNEWSGLEVASGGGIVPFVLPNSPPRGPHSIVNLATDGATGFTLNSQLPMQGTAPVVNGVITVGPGGNGWAILNGAGTAWNVGIYQGNPVTGMH